MAQRYGGWEALRRFTDVFDDQGFFRPAERPVERPTDAPKVQDRVEPAPSVAPAGCESGGAAGEGRPLMLGLVLTALSLRRPARARGWGAP